MTDIKYKGTKLDGRYTGYPWFSHYVTVTQPRGITYNQTSIKLFNEIRNWCWETWGPSCELYDYDYLRRSADKASEDKDVNPYWSWFVKNNVRRIYLTQKGKVWFDLSW
jgi:hypothetical protein